MWGANCPFGGVLHTAIAPSWLEAQFGFPAGREGDAAPGACRGLTLQCVQAKSQGQEDHKQARHPRPQTGHCHCPSAGSPPDGSGEQNGLTGPKRYRDTGFRREGEGRDRATRNPTHRLTGDRKKE